MFCGGRKMSQDLFLEKMLEVLDSDQGITMDTLLSSLEEWDSLSVISFLAMVNLNTGKKLEPVKVQEAVYIKDLYHLVIA